MLHHQRAELPVCKQLGQLQAFKLGTYVLEHCQNLDTSNWKNPLVLNNDTIFGSATQEQPTGAQEREADVLKLFWHLSECLCVHPLLQTQHNTEF